MSRIEHPMSFLSGFSMKMSKKARYPNVMNETSSVIFSKDISIRMWKTARYPNVTNQASDVIFIWIFPWKMPKKLDTQMSWIGHPMSFLSGCFHENVKNSSIPRSHELSIRCHFYLDFSMKTSKKARYPNVMNETSSVIFISVFRENVKKGSIPKCHEWNIQCHFYLGFPIKTLKKSSIPKSHELSIWCHFYLDYSMKMSRAARYPTVPN